MARFGLATFRLQGECSSQAELHWHMITNFFVSIKCSQSIGYDLITSNLWLDYEAKVCPTKKTQSPDGHFLWGRIMGYCIWIMARSIFNILRGFNELLYDSNSRYHQFTTRWINVISVFNPRTQSGSKKRLKVQTKEIECTQLEYLSQSALHKSCQLLSYHIHT